MEELAPGFRFYPTEEELVTFYLHNLLQGNRPEQLHRVIPIIQFYEIEPWHLPKFAGEPCRGDPEQWFFFTPRQEREVQGGRPSRTTASGYWKATGSPNYVYSSDNRVVGVKKTMVFYKGKAPAGRKTKWKMHEYRAIEDANPSRTAIPKLRHEFSLCRVYVTSGSLLAFDRRPLEPAAKQAQPLADDRATTSSHNTTMAARTSSPDTSYSGEDRADRPESTGATDLEHPDYLQEPPLWDWEELNWH